MYSHLKELKIVEGASFVAGPACGMYLAQLGAEVIRFDQIGGGPDFNRWPKAPNGASLYWEGLNKGKKSIAIDLRTPEGRDLAVRLATAPGEGNGLFLTNFPIDGFLSHEKLAARRQDQITVRIMGWADGTSAVDYTINCAVGLPEMTGAIDASGPVNHVLPAWDLLSGALAALSLLAAERRRRETQKGEEIRVPLSDVAISTLANLGQLGEVIIGAADRPRVGNDLFGAFGRDFVTANGKRVMVTAITKGQWKSLVAALDIEPEITQIERHINRSFAEDEGLRFEHRATLNPIVENAIGARQYNDVVASFDETGVCWGPYRSLRNALMDDPRLVQANPIFAEIEQPSGYAYPAPGFPAHLLGEARSAPHRAPFLGEHTEEILTCVLGCSETEIARLFDSGVVETATSNVT